MTDANLDPYHDLGLKNSSSCSLLGTRRLVWYNTVLVGEEGMHEYLRFTALLAQLHHDNCTHIEVV
jgi:hypothetical protein